MRRTSDPPEPAFELPVDARYLGAAVVLLVALPLLVVLWNSWRSRLAVERGGRPAWRDAALVALAAAVLTAGVWWQQRTPPHPQDVAASQRWEANGPSSYAFTYTTRGTSTHESQARVVVRDGAVVDVRALGERAATWPPPATVEDLIDLVADAREDGRTVEVVYDERWGHPTFIQVGGGSGGPWTATLTDLAPTS